MCILAAEKIMRRFIAAAMFLLSITNFIGAQSAKVAVDKASLRGRPADEAKVVETLARNTEVEVIKVEGLWYLVQSADYAGWVFIKDLDVKPSPAKTVLQTAGTIPASPSAGPATPSRTAPDAKGRTYIRGPRGGCFYLNASGSKVYVAHELCS
jgi:uncharacterized protein YgiM (DUF1202 family)